MKKSINLEAATLRVLSGFYRNDLALFSRHANEQFLFSIPGYAPCEQTPLSIRSLSLFRDPETRYAVRKTNEPAISRTERICSILMEYTLDIYHREIPDGQRKLRLLVCWCNLGCDTEHPEWRIVLFQIADEHAQILSPQCDAAESLFPVQRDAIVSEGRPVYSALRRNLIGIKDRTHSIHFLEKDDIIWVESDHMHSIIHAHSGTFTASATLSHLAENALSCLYRPHVSYLINPHYLHRIGHMQLILTDGTVIPVPERRFAQVKKDLCRAVS